MTESRTALVTGGSRGIGEATVRLFRVRGWDVVFTYVSNADAAATVAADTGARAERCDSGDEADILALFAALDGDGVVLDALVNNAGITGPKRRLEEVTVETLAALCRVNFIGPVVFCREAVKRMSTKHGGRGGAIVNLSSVSGMVGGANLAAYNASKGGVRLLTKSVALHCARKAYDIRCNSVHPSFAETAMLDHIAENAREPEKARTAMAAQVPLGRLAQAGEIATMVAYLASEDAGFVTGAEFVIDGGLTA